MGGLTKMTKEQQWSSLDLSTDITNQGSMSLRVHFITKEWEMTSLNIEFSPFEEGHTGEKIANGLKVMLERHGVSEKYTEGIITTAQTTLSPDYAATPTSHAFYEWPRLWTCASSTCWIAARCRP